MLNPVITSMKTTKGQVWALFPNVNECEVIVCMGRMGGARMQCFFFNLVVGGG